MHTHTHSQPNVREHLAVRTAPVRPSVPSESGWPASVRAHKYRTACSNIFTGCDIDMSRWRSHERARSGPKTHTHTQRTRKHTRVCDWARDEEVLDDFMIACACACARATVSNASTRAFASTHQYIIAIRMHRAEWRDPQPPRSIGTRIWPSVSARARTHTHNVSAASSSSFVCTGRRTRTRCVL